MSKKKVHYNALVALDRVEMKRALDDYYLENNPSQLATLIDGRKLCTLTLAEQIALDVHYSKMSGKLKGLFAISTTCVVNANCLLAMNDPDSPCHECFAAKLASTYNALRQWLECNYNILTTRLLTDSEIERLCKKLEKSVLRFVRIEFAGDVGNVLQAVNYLRIMKAGKTHGLNFGVWTKLPHIWDTAIKQEGKADNATYILSACQLDQVDYPLLAAYDWIDCVFVVCKPETYDETKKYLLENTNYRIHDCKCIEGSCSSLDICGKCYSGELRKVNNNGIVTVILENLRRGKEK